MHGKSDVPTLHFHVTPGVPTKLVVQTIMVKYQKPVMCLVPVYRSGNKHSFYS